jgi:hypothetical protein
MIIHTKICPLFSPDRVENGEKNRIERRDVEGE